MPNYKFPDKLDPKFKEFYETIVAISGLDLPITSDWRSPEANAGASGSSSTSLHLSGRAVDLDTNRNDSKRFFIFAKAVFLASLVMDKRISLDVAMDLSHPRPTDLCVELEMVNSDKDTHIHLGLDPKAPGGELIVRAD